MGNPLDWTGLLSSGAGLLSSGINQILNSKNMDKQFRYQKDLMRMQNDYNVQNWHMQNSYNTPAAQMQRLKAAGLNPDLMYGNGAAGVQAPLPSPVSEGSAPGYAPASFDGSFANDLAAVAAAKKSGMDVKSMEKDLQIKDIDKQRQELELSLRQKYGSAQIAADLARSYADVRLALLSGDDKQADIAIKEWTKAKEKALSETQEKQRDLLQKELETYDERFKVYKSSVKSQNAANYGSAKASNTQAGVNVATEDSIKLDNWLKRQTNAAHRNALLDQYAKEHWESKAQIEELKNKFQYYEKLNENNKNEAASYLNYLIWYVKQNTPDLLGFLLGKASK